MASKDPAAQVLFILWSALLVSQLMLFGVGQIVPPPPDSTQSPEDLQTLAIVFTVLGIATALASALVVPMLLGGKQTHQTVMILRWGLAETPTIFGLLLAMMGAEMYWTYMLTGLGLVAHFTAFPSKS